MTIIALFLLAYAVYFFATLKTTNPYEIRDTYEKLYIGEDADATRSDFAYEKDLYGQFGNRVGSPSDTYTPAPDSAPRYVGEPIPVTPIKNPVSDQSSTLATPVGTETNPETIVKREDPAPISTGYILLDDIYTSKTNSRITFPIPKGAQVKETSTNTTGSSQIFTFSVQDKDITITVEKTASGCFNPLISFAIPAGLGIDYRILYSQKEITLPNTYRSIIGVEEYGTYKGSIGFRGTSCVQSAVPTKIDVRTAGWKKDEKQEALKTIEELLSKMMV